MPLNRDDRPFRMDSDALDKIFACLIPGEPETSVVGNLVEELRNGLRKGAGLAHHINETLAARSQNGNESLRLDELLTELAQKKARNEFHTRDHTPQSPSPDPKDPEGDIDSTRLTAIEKRLYHLEEQQDRLLLALETWRKQMARQEPGEMVAQTKVSPHTESTLETVSIGIIPENVTEQAWPLLQHNLEVAGVPIPGVKVWITRETLTKLQHI